MKKLIAFALAAILACGTSVFAHPFSDALGHWAEAEIEKGYTNKTINGDPDGRFRPDDTVTRAEFLKMLTACICEKYGVEIPDNFGNEVHWASKYYNFSSLYIYKTQDADQVDGVVPGVMTTAEDYDKEIMRWEMAFMMSEAMTNLMGEEAPDGTVGDFKDTEKIDSYGKRISAGIYHCNVMGLMNGDEQGLFSPAGKGTRAEAVTVINRIDGFIQKTLESYEETAKKEEEEYNKTIEESLVTYDNIPKGHPVVTVTMSDNQKFKIELYPEYAPQTVANFVKLVEDGFYNGLTFHRVVEGFVAQGGDPNGNGTGGSGSYIKGEFSTNGFEKNTLLHTKGVVSMARTSHPDSASSQFFICYDDASFLDGSYAAFGKVISGMNVVDSFVQKELTMSGSGEVWIPAEPIVIKQMTVR